MGKLLIPCDGCLDHPSTREIANCITARYDNGISNRAKEGTTVVVPIRG